MNQQFLYVSIALCLFALGCSPAPETSSEKSFGPTAIFHAFNQQYSDVASFVCTLADQGYSHVQISPAQKSNPGGEWWKRYQPLDLSVIEGLGTEAELGQLIDQAASCNVKIIADVVFNHMANLDGGEDFEDLTKYPNLSPADFNTVPSNLGQKPCDINYSDGDRSTELDCWLGGLPDLKFTDNVKAIQKAHLKMLLDLGVAGFRFDAAKHIPAEVLSEYMDFIDRESGGMAWSYLEVIQDGDTSAEDYNAIAPVSDFILYGSMKTAFTFGGDLRSLPANAIDDPSSVTFGRNHDTIAELNAFAINPYDEVTDAYLADAYVLARQDGVPLVFNEDNLSSPFIPTGVKFRQIMAQRQGSGQSTTETILRAIDSPTIVFMERGAEGFFVANKGADALDLPVLNLTLTNLEGCYRELRNGFTVAVEQRGDQKIVTRWGSFERGGIEVQGRDALYFVREPFDQCQ
ncbi:MAG: alpha-amylase family glycosyl hydrolase [Elainellaceae cyanobacterium]